MAFRLADGLSLPPEAITQTFAILARRGAGKTYTAAVLAEEMLESGYPIVVLDPIGVWWGLRSQYPIVILGGERADAPLEPTGGKVVAEFIVHERVPVILDVSAFGENDMRRFVGEFASEFYRANRQAIHWFVDEADEFAPQQAAGGPLAKCLGAMQNIVRRGRARGIGCTLITQRSAVLNKSVLTQTECLIAMQTTGPHDLRAIDDWIKYHGTPEEREKIMRTLPTLSQGDAWVYSPAWLKLLKRVHVRKRRTFDSSATPKPGERREAPRSLAEIDLGALTKKLGETIERAKADDPAELRKQLAALQKQLSAAQANQPTKGKFDQAAIDAAVSRAVRDRDKFWQQQVSILQSELRYRARTLTEIAKSAGKFREGDLVEIASPPVVPSSPSRAMNGEPRAKSAPLRAITVGDRSLGKCERAILLACYWLRDETPSKAKVSFYSSYSASSSGFNNALGSLRSAGLLQGFAITDAGIRAIGTAPDKPGGSDLREWLRPRLGRCENMILDTLIQAHPKRLGNDALSEASGYSSSSSGFNNALGKLRTIEAIEGYERTGGTKAADVFFE